MNRRPLLLHLPLLPTTLHLCCVTAGTATADYDCCTTNCNYCHCYCGTTTHLHCLASVLRYGNYNSLHFFATHCNYCYCFYFVHLSYCTTGFTTATSQTEPQLTPASSLLRTTTAVTATSLLPPHICTALFRYCVTTTATNSTSPLRTTTFQLLSLPLLLATASLRTNFTASLQYCVRATTTSSTSLLRTRTTACCFRSLNQRERY